MKEICKIESEATTLCDSLTGLGVVHVVVKKNIILQHPNIDDIQEYFTACNRKLLSSSGYIETRRGADCKTCQRIMKKHKREQDVPTIYVAVGDDGQHFIGSDTFELSDALIAVYGEEAVIKMLETKGSLVFFKGRGIKLKPVVQITKSLVALNEV